MRSSSRGDPGKTKLKWFRFERRMSKDQIIKNSYVWNTVGSLLGAFQSVIMLMVLTRVCDLETAGMFTIAYASANLFLNMGNYGMRNFQASDVKPMYSFASYVSSRIVTDVAMLLCSTAYLAWSAIAVGYGWYKVAVIFCMTLFKLVDSIEDVTDGNYQQHGRLDVGGKLQTARLTSTLVVFCVAAIFTGDLLVPLIVATVWTLVVYVVGVVVIRKKLSLPACDLIEAAEVSRDTGSLLKECFPLFLAAFLLFYIGNAPKYAIDANLDDASQAIYGFIAMPVFVVGLLAQFIYMPIIEPLGRQWAAGDVSGFRRVIFKQVGCIVALTLICDAGAALLGAPVLGVLYNTDLHQYVAELVELVTGGGFLAITSLMTTGITIMREQRHLTIGYVVVALTALMLSPIAVRADGIAGASRIYLAMMVVLAAWFTGVFIRFARVSH